MMSSLRPTLRRARTRTEAVTSPTVPAHRAASRAVLDALPGGTRIAVSCSGGGIRSAAFNLGALQTLQERADVYAKVSTITAVSGGSYVAAAHAIAEQALTGQAPTDPKAYALGSPEETHLRDHTRYLFEDWSVALRGLGHLLWGLLVNVFLVSAVLYVAAHLLGWGLRVTGALRGTGTGQPSVHLGSTVWLPVALAAAAVVAGTRTDHPSPGPVPVGATAVPAPRRPVAALAGGAVLAAVLLIGTPYAVQGLSALSHQHDAAGTVVQTIWSTVGQRSGPGVGSLATFVTALAVLVRTMLGRVQVLARDLRGTGLSGGTTQKVVTWLRERLTPWVGATFAVGVFSLLFLRWVAAASAVPVLHGPPWASPLATTGYALLALLATKLLVDVNETSMHSFYRDRLSAAYAVTRSGAAGVRPAGDIRLSELGGRTPELVVCAAANCTETGNLPPGRGAVSFTFTPDSVGLSTGATAVPDLTRHDRIETRRFEQRCGRGAFGRTRPFTAFDAVAVSGAAVSPVMGKLTRASHRLLFTLANVRLGLWLRPPWWLHEHTGHDRPVTTARGRLRRELARRLRQPDLTRLYAEAFGSLHLNGRWLYVTDGGHYENLGVVEALRRRPDLLIVLDASADGPNRGATLGQAVALARTECGVQVDIDPRPTFPSPGGRTGTAAVVGTFTYPDAPLVPHHLLYARLAVPDDAPWDVQAYRQANATFPTDSTLQQLYDSDEFEAYRALGAYAATSLLAARVMV